MNYKKRYFELLKNYSICDALLLVYFALLLSYQSEEFFFLFGLLLIIIFVVNYRPPFLFCFVSVAWSGFISTKTISHRKGKVLTINYSGQNKIAFTYDVIWSWFWWSALSRSKVGVTKGNWGEGKMKKLLLQSFFIKQN